MSDFAPSPLRLDLEITATEHEQNPVFVLRDPEGLSDKVLAVSPGALAVASLFDGKRTAGQIQEEVARDTGAPIMSSDIEGLARQLAEAGLLETPELTLRRGEMLAAFKASPKRPMALEGAYPTAPLELASHMGAFFRDSKGPGKPPADKPSVSAPPLGLVCPHIDLHRGGPAYAWSYAALADSPPPDVVVAFGVAHSSPNSPWVMTPKEYETPCGPMAVDRELYKELAGTLWYEPTADEWAHRREHSLEFQALWLRYIWRDKTPPWVPILTSTFERFSPDAPPSSIETVNKALEAMGAVLARLQKKGKRVMVLAGIDLAHVGPRFGDDLKLGPELEARVEKEDRVSIEKALKLDADGFYSSVVADGHWRKVCGLSALYSSLRCLKALGAKDGKLLTYGQAPDPAGGLVSFTSAIFPK
jgi:MEMO1 family protein